MTEEKLINLAEFNELILSYKGEIKLQKEAIETQKNSIEKASEYIKTHAEKAGKLYQFICENVCYDDCGFDPEKETKESLVEIFKTRDIEARKVILEFDKI